MKMIVVLYGTCTFVETASRRNKIDSKSLATLVFQHPRHHAVGVGPIQNTFIAKYSLSPASTHTTWCVSSDIVSLESRFHVHNLHVIAGGISHKCPIVAGLVGPRPRSAVIFAAGLDAFCIALIYCLFI